MTTRHYGVVPNCPCYWIQGELDKGINQVLDPTLAALTEASNARVMPWANAGHFANVEQPAAFNQILDTFLRQREERQSRLAETAPVR